MPRLRTGYGSGVRLRSAILPWQISSGSGTILSRLLLQRWMPMPRSSPISGWCRPASRKRGMRARCSAPLISVRRSQRSRRSRAVLPGSLRSGKNCPGSIVVIGNAPSALISLCSMIQDGIRPAVVIGAPVGFVNAAESKELLRTIDIPSISTEGTRGEHRLQLRPSTNASPSLLKAPAMKDPLTGFEYPEDWVAKCTQPGDAPAGRAGPCRAHLIRPCPPPRVHDRHNRSRCGKGSRPLPEDGYGHAYPSPCPAAFSSMFLRRAMPALRRQ